MMFKGKNSSWFLGLNGFIRQDQTEVRVHQLRQGNALQLIQSTQSTQKALGCKQ